MVRNSESTAFYIALCSHTHPRRKQPKTQSKDQHTNKGERGLPSARAQRLHLHDRSPKLLMVETNPKYSVWITLLPHSTVLLLAYVVLLLASRSLLSLRASKGCNSQAYRLSGRGQSLLKLWHKSRDGCKFKVKWGHSDHDSRHLETILNSRKSVTGIILGSVTPLNQLGSASHFFPQLTFKVAGDSILRSKSA